MSRKEDWNRNRDDSRRLQYYRQILQKSPEYCNAAAECEVRQSGLTPAEQLYLNVFAPVLLSYIKWVLGDAARSGIKRLYFLARDGYQMYLAAGKLCEAWGLDIECRYLSVSRYAIRVPEYHLLGEQCLAHICIGGIDVTFEKIMKRAALTEEEGLEIAALTGYDGRYRQCMNYREIMQLKEKLKEQEKFFRYVYRHSKEAYPAAAGYLKQEGLSEEVPYALVDSGWVGTLQQSIQNLVNSVRTAEEKKTAVRLKGYYFGLYELPHGKDKGDYRAYYFEPGGSIRRKVHFSNCLFEAVFSAPEGMTVGYVKKENRYLPVTEQKENPNRQQIVQNIALLEHFLKQYLAGNSVRPFRETAAEEDFLTGESRLTEELLSKFMGEPTRFEIEAYGGNLFSDDVLEHDLRRVSAELSEEEIKNQSLWNKTLIMLGIKKAEIRESAWVEGSIVKNGRHVKRNLRHAALYKYFVYIRKRLKETGK